MRSFRLFPASWQMLQRLSQPTAVLIFCNEDGRFHFHLHDVRLDLVRPETFDALNKAGVIARERYTVPSYRINEKGISALRSRLPKAEFADEDVPLMQNIRVVSERLDG